MSCVEEDDYLYPLPQDAVQWIENYCTKITVYYTPSFSLPSSVIEALSKVKKCGTTKVFRGMSFSLHNIDKGIEIMDSVDPSTMTLTLSSSLPMSTSKDIEVAESFADSGMYLALLELDAEEQDVLVDLTLLDNNDSAAGAYYKEEKEIILLPGTYTFNVIGYPHIDNWRTELLALQELLQPYFIKDKVGKSTLSMYYDSIYFTGDSVTVELDLSNNNIEVSSTTGDILTLRLREGDVVIDSDNDYVNEKGNLSFLVENADVLFG